MIPAIAFAAGVVFGWLIKPKPRYRVNLENENEKLRKENEVLWARISRYMRGG